MDIVPQLLAGVAALIAASIGVLKYLDSKVIKINWKVDAHPYQGSLGRASVGVENIGYRAFTVGECTIVAGPRVGKSLWLTPTASKPLPVVLQPGEYISFWVEIADVLAQIDDAANVSDILVGAVVVCPIDRRLVVPFHSVALKTFRVNMISPPLLPLVVVTVTPLSMFLHRMKRRIFPALD